jgi:hypothetical protein
MMVAAANKNNIWWKFGSDRSSCVSLFLAGRIHDTMRELWVMEMFRGEEICQVLGASSL